MRKINGHNQKGVEGNFRKTLMGNRYLNGCVVALCLIILTGCSAIKKAAIVGASAGLGATAGSVIAGGAIAPIAGSMIAASAASVATGSMEKDGPTQLLEVQADTVVNNAPDNFWTLLGRLTQMGGWALLLIVIVPMLFSWLLPGPIQFKGKKGK